MRHRRVLTVVWGMMAVLLFSGLTSPLVRAQGPARNRITAAIRSDQMQVMQGTVRPLPAHAQDQGQLKGSTEIQNMSLTFRLSAAQEADLKNLLEEQQTKGSPLYHQWLLPGQFAARYGVSQQDLAKAAAWLKSQGFAVQAIPASADRIDFSGTAAQVEAAFHTQLNRYAIQGMQGQGEQSQGRQGWRNSTAISLPDAIAGMALGIEHLDTFRPLPHVVKRAVYARPHRAAATVGPNYTLCNSSQSPCPSSSQVNFISPSDAQTIYDVTGLYNNDNTGAGQTMAVVGQTDIVQYQSDIARFRTLSGLNASNLPTQILVTNPDTGPAVVSVPDLLEADIDTEWSGAIAKDAQILYVTVGSNPNYSVFDSLIYTIQNPLIDSSSHFVPVISISYGGCEQQDFSLSYIQYMETFLQEASAQGQTVVASSGDVGSAACDDTDSSASPATKGLGADYPASSQYVTGVGGTSFSGDIGDPSTYWNTTNTASNGSAMGYIPETVWNNTATLAQLNSIGALSASGGGQSQLFTKPSWQVGLNVPADGKRDLPDVSLASDPNHDGYVLCTEQTNASGTAFDPTPAVSSCGTGNSVAYFGANYNYVYGGTSIAAPQIAAMILLWNQAAKNTFGVGNANPILYQSAQTTPGAFHDTTTGSNAVVCQQGSPNCISSGSGSVLSCCAATSGYDQATGLGSVDAAAIGGIWPRLTEVNGSFSLLLKPATVTVNPGASASTQMVLSPSGAGAGTSGFSGTVNLTCTNLPAGVSCSFAPGSSVTLSPGTAQTLTVTISATSSAAAFSVVRNHSPTPLHRHSPLRMAFAGLLGLALLGVGRKRRYFPSRWMGVLLIAVGLMAATSLTACAGGSASGGGSSGGSTPITQTVTVTGTSGTTVASAQIELTVT
ncbi:MAG: S53 family serine peptidase [Acidobacteriaceae bacterium]